MDGLLHLGFGSYIPIRNVELITEMKPTVTTLRRIIDNAREKNMVVDCTRGRKLRSVVLTSAGFVYFSNATAKTLRDRYHELLQPLPLEYREGGESE